MDKAAIRDAMLALEADALAHAKEHYEEYLAEARLDRTEPIENDEQAQAEIASELAEAFDHPVHAHSDKIAKLKTLDFGPKVEVEEGAVVSVGGRNFVISVSTTKFDCDGETYMGVSPQAPIFAALEGRRAGETTEFRGRKLTIDAVA
ncbi:MAG: hypothetical protein AAFQ67_03350 [Pseudomonadota bacterium]